MRLHVSPAKTNGVKFILADVPVDHLLFPGRRVEMPLPVRFHQGNRKWPVVRPHFEADGVGSFIHKVAALRHLGGKPLRIVCVLNGVAGLKLGERRAEKFTQGFSIVCLSGGLQGFDGLVRRGEHLLGGRRLLRRIIRRKPRCQNTQSTYQQCEEQKVAGTIQSSQIVHRLIKSILFKGLCVSPSMPTATTAMPSSAEAAATMSSSEAPTVSCASEAATAMSPTTSPAHMTAMTIISSIIAIAENTYVGIVIAVVITVISIVAPVIGRAAGQGTRHDCH